MSKQRKVTIRRTDWAVIEALKMALAQYGVQTRKDSHASIVGNKSDGVVEVTTYNNAGVVFLEGPDGVFLRIMGVAITTLDGKVLRKPKVVKFRDSEEAVPLILAFNLTEHRKCVIYQLVGVAEGFDTAISLLGFLQKYPRVAVDGEDIQLTYRPCELGIVELVLRYNRTRGYTCSTIRYDDGRERRFRCHRWTDVWTEEK